MRKYITSRPGVYPLIQWDGTNIEEFQALTGNDWTYLRFNPLLFTDNDGVLEIRDSNNSLLESLPLGYWCGGPGFVVESLQDTNDSVVLEGTGPFRYVVTED
jgi:hypothetical protein